jgi:hypothetical protein
MRSLRAVLADRRDNARPQRVVYVGSHEDRLSRVPAMRLSDDDNGRTTEDVRRQKAEGRGLYGGGPPSRLVD